jgi:hypothetical protein
MWFYSQQGQEICLYFTVSKSTLGPNQPPIQWGTRSSFPQGTTAEVQTARSFTSNSTILSWRIALVKARLYVYIFIHCYSLGSTDQVSHSDSSPELQNLYTQRTWNFNPLQKVTIVINPDCYGNLRYYIIITSMVLSIALAPRCSLLCTQFRCLILVQ